ncbi:MAG: caspase family protein [Hyphomicrobiaceae bacterium]
MLPRLFALSMLLIAQFAVALPADARRVALVVGQSTYKGGHAATVGLAPLKNPRNDAVAISALLAKAGFEVISCDGTKPACFDLDAKGLAAALDRLQARAKVADTALVFFAGHGMATEQGNILAATDARFDCTTGALANGVAIERVMQATAPARNKLVILDACRDNPVTAVCPALAGKKLSFTRIEAGALDRFLLVTSTQFGQEALDNPDGDHSPFAAALMDALQDHPRVYFEQVLNEVAATTFKAAAAIEKNFRQLPGKVVGGAAPSDCLAGRDCLGDPRMAALARDNEALAGDAAGVRTLIAEEERARGKPYTAAERARRVADLTTTLANLAASSDPKRQEARRLIEQGDVNAGEAKLDEALDADEKAVLEAERVAREKRKAAASSARDLARLAQGRDVAKAIAYFKRATRLDPEDATTWQDLGEMAVAAGQLGEAKAAFEQAAAKARDGAEVRIRYWATLGLGDVARAQGSLPSARRLYETAGEIARREAAADKGNAWLAARPVGFVQQDRRRSGGEGNLPEARNRSGGCDSRASRGGGQGQSGLAARPRRFRMTVSATFWWRRATCRRR